MYHWRVSRPSHLIAILAALGEMGLSEANRDSDYLTANGWICLGEEAFTGHVHWTNRERGIGPGGPVTKEEALRIQRGKSTRTPTAT
jgi:hypothetical protein